MKIKKITVCGIITILSLSVLAGCSRSSKPKMANELRFRLDDNSDVTISYDEEPITFLEADGNDLVIKEYMTANKSSYYAEVKQDNNSIHVSEGGKPFFKDHFSRYIEVYLPAAFKNNLTVTTTDGDIDLSGINLELSALHINSTEGNLRLSKASASSIRISSTSGTLDLGSIGADNITLETTSGNITCNELAGSVVYTSTSGNLNVKSAVGSGTYKANNSGKLKVIYTEVMNDLSFFNKNDNIDLTIPKDLEFEFEAITKNGYVSTPFQEKIKVEDRTTYGTIGSNPTVTIKAETNNGNIKVTQ